MHRIYCPNLAGTGETVEILGDEAHHAARTKRLGPGDEVELFDGLGATAESRVAGTRKLPGKQGWALDVAIVRRCSHPRQAPTLIVRSGVPKGPRLEQMVESLSQVGAAAWSPLASAHSVVDPREGKLARMERVALESAKQCGRAWVMEIAPSASFDDSLAPETRVVLANAGAPPYEAQGAERVTLLIGPEGGWSPDEVERAEGAGAIVAGFGRHVMRIETAAPVAAMIVLQAHACLV